MNTRKDNNGKALKAWKALPPAHIARPLKHLRSRLVIRDLSGNIQFKQSYYVAERAAKRGDGVMVKFMARALV